MKYAILIVILFLTASFSFAQQNRPKKKNPDKEKTKLLESLNLDSWDLAIQRRDVQVQEEVKVEAEDYPGLNINIENPVESLGAYKPYTKQELQAYSDLITDYSLAGYDASVTARPHKPGRLFTVRVPD